MQAQTIDLLTDALSQVTHHITNQVNQSVKLQDQIKTENSVQTFWHEELEDLTVFKINGESWFVAKEVTEKLGYDKSNDAIKYFCPNSRLFNYWELQKIEAKGDSKSPLKFDLGRYRTGCTLIPRQDLFALIHGSKKPQAQIMRDWVNNHILPSIQDTGQYTMLTHPNSQPPQPTQQLPTKDLLPILEKLTKAVQALVEQQHIQTNQNERQLAIEEKKKAEPKIKLPKDAPVYFTASQIGASHLRSVHSVQQVNTILRQLGVIKRHHKFNQAWEFTEYGKQYEFKDKTGKMRKPNPTSSLLYNKHILKEFKSIGLMDPPILDLSHVDILNPPKHKYDYYEMNSDPVF